MIISDYKTGDEHQILKLFETVFRQKLSLENWQWRFRDNPAGKHFIKLMWEGDKLIGHYAVSPVYMNIEGEEVFTALSLTTMTHPDYGGRGVFKQLSSAMYQYLESKFQCKAIWGFPNNNSHYGFVKRLGWTNLSVLHTLGLKSQNIKPKGLTFTVNTISSFNNHHQAFISKKISKFAKIYIIKNKNYLNWRFIKKPNTSYTCYEFRTNSSQAIFVIKPYPLPNQNKYDLNIIDLYMDNYEDIHDYILHIVKDLNIKIDRVSLWKNVFSPEHLSLEKQGFIPVLPQTYLAARVHSSMPECFSDYRHWHISMGASDVF